MVFRHFFCRVFWQIVSQICAPGWDELVHSFAYCCFVAIVLQYSVLWLSRDRALPVFYTPLKRDRKPSGAYVSGTSTYTHTHTHTHTHIHTPPHALVDSSFEWWKILLLSSPRRFFTRQSDLAARSLHDRPSLSTITPRRKGEGERQWMETFYCTSYHSITYLL